MVKGVGSLPGYTSKLDKSVLSPYHVHGYYKRVGTFCKAKGIGHRFYGS